jgi:2,5-diamino-6-(ribosylamino)-4(3H)-pyrimidinone 5'-phosphate reductase
MVRNVHHTRPGWTARHLPAGVLHSLPIPIVMDRRCRLAVDCKLIRNYTEGKGNQPWVICSKTHDGEVLARREKLESAGARIVESDDNGE